MARVQWSAQRLAQGKEEQADEAKTREKPYEELGQMLVQSDETWLEEALKRDDAETAIKEAETAKYIAEKQHSLKQKIAAKARNENDLKSFCRVHQALGVLQQAVIAYDRAVGSYVDEFGSDHPPQKALSVKAVLERKPDDLFWFKPCSIQEMSHGPRTPTVRKAFKRYSTGTVFMKIATPSSRNSPTDSMDLRARWEITGRFQPMGFQAVGVGRGNEDVEFDNFPSRDFCIRSLYLVSETREAHRILKLHWVRDGLVRLERPAWPGALEEPV
ncbi:hypothetical protein I307_01515 [Cryptococcus deuterogattii 99/473]|uniref:Unplaced genomic scaffold supercont1.11, whole genome shotgun sequence n=1 Tax=Cryptococcus deuterogattii Ram5 TaxID=1296110 RepID=A0A0D0TUU1_9TREE|nr:hypothetical protein I313_04659 [Cryptococcus deuterogattii Ram5]KIR99276.1 hypothetical protein L804_02901 [Cryptococcus deuterogattii 2001/935-1]KIY59263.1 hypothetical protein I307_01515 [Cryptococcus deuterogattii 99/473]